MIEDGAMALFIKVVGYTFNSHMNFMERLRRRLYLREVVSVDESSIIIAFVAVVSRVGTDIEAALQRIYPTNRPVVLVVLHHTYDPYYIAPDSRLIVDRRDVFTVDCLFHEDQGLLRCLQNDEALKAVTDHLISKGVTISLPVHPDRPPAARGSWGNWFRDTLILIRKPVMYVLAVFCLYVIFTKFYESSKKEIDHIDQTFTPARM